MHQNSDNLSAVLLTGRLVLTKIWWRMIISNNQSIAIEAI